MTSNNIGGSSILTSTSIGSIGTGGGGGINSNSLRISRSSRNSSLSILALSGNSNSSSTGGGGGDDGINSITTREGSSSNSSHESFNNTQNQNSSTNSNSNSNSNHSTEETSINSMFNNNNNQSIAQSNNNGNTGFIITSRTKHYLPPNQINSKSGTTKTTTTTTSLPSTSPLIPSSPLYPTSLSHNPSGSSSFRSRRSSPPAPFRLKENNSGVTDELLPTSSSNNNSNSNSQSFNSSEAKTTLHLSSSVDAQGRRMVNQYIRLKTIGQGSHGKVWLCAEPSSIIKEESDDNNSLSSSQQHIQQQQRESGGTGGIDERRTSSSGFSFSRRSSNNSKTRRHGKGVSSNNGNQSDEEDELAGFTYCAIKSVAREGTGRGKSLRLAKGRKAAGNVGENGPGIGADDKVKREVAIMKRLDHRNVVRLKEVIDDVKSKKVFMVLEFMAGGQIEWQDNNKQPTMTVDEARRTFRDVVLGLEYLHYQGIIHRDIKPANLLWTEDHSIVKISDFGVSHVSDALFRVSPGGTETDDDKALRKTAGSPAFFAPELCHPAEYINGSNTYSNPNSVGLSKDEGSNYFSNSHFTNNRGSATPSGSILSGGSTISGGGNRNSSDTLPSTPTAPRFLPATISLPLASPSSLKPRSRPIIGKGIDVWALGVTLYCLLFGDTPFMARTEYELYNVIVKESVKVPEKMGREGAWTGVGVGWDGCGDGVEGREVVDLLSKLLEKDPLKRIGLAEVKKHPWVLRNLSSSPDTWLCDTDPTQSNTVEVTEEDLQHATQERGIISDSNYLIPISNNRPGIRKVLHAALIRFPAFSRMGKNSNSNSNEGNGGNGKKVNGGRSRSKSNSSQSFASELPSRHPSDATTRSSTLSNSGNGNSPSGETGYSGVDLRRIISSKDRLERDSSPTRNNSSNPNSPVAGGGRGGWGSRTNSNSRTTNTNTTNNNNDSIFSSTATTATSTARTSKIELSRTVSNSSNPSNNNNNNSSTAMISHNSNSSSMLSSSKIIPSHLLPERIDSRNPSNFTNTAPSNSSRSSSPFVSSTTSNSNVLPDSNSLAGRKTFSKLLSRLGSNNSRNQSKNSQKSEEVTDEEIEREEFQHPQQHQQYQQQHQQVVQDQFNPKSSQDFTGEGIGGIIDSSEFEYSSDDDELVGMYDDGDEEDDDEESQDYEELSGPALASLTGIKGWQSGFKNFDVLQGGDNNHHDDEDEDEYSDDQHIQDDLNRNRFQYSSVDETTPRRPSYQSTTTTNSTDFSDFSPPPTHSQYPPQFNRQSSNTPSRSSRKSFGASSGRDGSIRNGFTGTSGSGGSDNKKWQPESSSSGNGNGGEYEDGEEYEDEEDGTEMFVAPRKRVIPINK